MQFSHLLGKLKLNPQEFLLQFKSHPEHPSALAFSDTLNFMGIKNNAYELDKEFWKELPKEFITIYDNNFTLIEKENESYRIHSNESSIVSQENLFTKTNNFVLLFENNLKASTRSKYNYSFYIFAIVGLLVLYSILYLNWEEAIFNAFSALGIYISLELFNKKFAGESALLNNICGGSIGKIQTSCSKIIESDKINISGLKLSDLSLIYFTGILLLGIFFPATSLILKITSCSTAFVILYSLYIQGFVEKSFCKICLILIAVLIVQIVISTQYFSSVTSLKSIFLSLLTFGITFFTVMVINSLLKQRENLQNANIKNIRFIRNYDIFRSELLKNSKHNFLHTDMFSLGKNDTRLKISLISNPYCGFCKDAHRIMEELLQKYPEDISAQIRFNYTTKSTNKNFDSLINDLVLIYNHNRNEFVKAITNWFENRNEKKISERYNPDNGKSDLNEIIEIGDENAEKGFNFTPVFLINGYQFPDKYDREDIFYFIDDLLEDEEIC